MNIAELLGALPKGEPAKQPTAPPRLLVQHAAVQDGVVSLTDLSGRAPQTAAVQPINVELHDITTLRDRRGPYTVSATLRDGGVLSWDGQVSLVPLASTGRLDLRGFPLATAWRFVQDDVAIAEPTGELGANVRYQFAYRDGTTSLQVEGVEVAIRGLVLTERTTNAPLRNEKGTLYEGGIRVPMVVRWPSVTKPGTVTSVPAFAAPAGVPRRTPG